MTYFLDLFSGIGGFALGAYWAGLRFDGHYFSDIEPSAVKLYQKRFPDAVGLGDIKTIRAGDLPKGDYIITGGFPCQDLSGIRKGAGLDGKRSGLYKEYIRLIGDLRPRYAVMENVTAIFRFDIGRLLGDLSDVGYDSEWAVDWASRYGLPHYRERFFLCAYPQGIRRQEIFNRKTPKNRFIPEACVEKELRVRTCFYDKPLEKMEDTAATMADVWGDSDGVSERMDRLHGLGNAIVPQIAQMIFEAPAFDEWRKGR